MDIEHFKRVNDESGHPLGDSVLKELATRLKSVAR
jgi:diguanylate cyclase (GGDEF)-like protein